MGTELVVPTSRDAVFALDSPTLYVLERAGEIAREILDGRIVAWTEQGGRNGGSPTRLVALGEPWPIANVGSVLSRPAIEGIRARWNWRSPPIPIKVPTPRSSNAEVIPGQIELVERTDEERLNELREQRLQLWADEVGVVR